MTGEPLRGALGRLGRSVFSRWGGLAARALPHQSDASTAAVQAAPPPLKPGVCLHAHLTSEIGLGQAAREIAKAADMAGIAQSFFNYPLQGRDNEPEFKARCGASADRLANLFVFGLPTLPHVSLPEVMDRRYNIFYPYWELSAAPEDCVSPMDLYDEIWAPSVFVAEMVKAVFKRQVTLVRNPLSVPSVRPQPWRPGDSLRIFTFFDTDSFAARKNPQGAITAFKTAFSTTRRDVRLVVKLRGDRDDGIRSWLGEQAERDPRIQIIDTTLSRADMDRLMASCDVYLSLHRSEGFGMGPAEALLRARPIVCTDYSGSRDYLSQATGYPVDYRLVPLKEDEYWSWPGQVWAEPSIESAAAALRAIYDDPSEASRRAMNGFDLLAQNYAPSHIGAQISDLLHSRGVMGI